jgi:transposase
VARYLRQAPVAPKPANAPIGSASSDDDSKPAIAPIGSASSDDDSKPAIAPIGSTGVCTSTDQAPAVAEQQAAGRPSDCEPWRAVIQAKLDLGLSAQRIHQDLVTEHGFTGSYYSVRSFVRGLAATQEWPFRRLECGPGEEAQVDFGSGAPILLPDGKRRRPHVFRIVLSHSRKGYSEAVARQTTDNFLRCLENAFWHFGGVPQRLVLDNLRAAVTRAD